MNIKKDSSMLLDIQYVKANKKNNTPDYLYVIWKDLDTNKKHLQVIPEPMMDIYFEKPEARNHKYNKNYARLEDVDKKTVKYKDIIYAIVDDMGDIGRQKLQNCFNSGNYSALKEDCWGKFSSDLWYAMLDLDNLIEATLNNDKYQLYYKLLIYKIDGKQNVAIQELLEKEFGMTHSVEYLSSLWRNKIPKMIAETAKERYLEWHFTYEEKGKWKKCTRCGKTKLATNRFFSKNSTSKDGWYSICKQCRNEKSTEMRKNKTK